MRPRHVTVERLRLGSARATTRGSGNRRNRAGSLSLSLLSLWHGFADDRRYIGAKVALIVAMLALAAMLEVAR